MVCGGTLGIFLAAALQLAGLRVAVVERGPLRGRAQEWNISRKEIAELVSCKSLFRFENETSVIYGSSILIQLLSKSCDQVSCDTGDLSQHRLLLDMAAGEDRRADRTGGAAVRRD